MAPSHPISTKEKGKRIAQKLFPNLFADNLDLKPETPLNPPPRPGSSWPPSDETINVAFNSLAISPSQKHQAASEPFVGGFAVQSNFYGADYATNPNTTEIAKPIPAPNPPMPVPYPQSLTMQMALRPEHFTITSNPVHSSPSLSGSALLQPPPLSSSKSDVLMASPSTPRRANQLKSPSLVSISSQKACQVQCSGVTKAGKQCSRMIKSAGPVTDGDYLSSPQFCFQHTKELLGPSGYYARKNGEWVNFEDWIPPYLQTETQVSLRVEMEKARSQSDVDGYIYTFEIREPQQTDTIKLKVGRAVNLVKRIDQWGKQCGSKEQILRGFFPGTVDPDDDGNPGSLMKGRVKAGEKGPWCHRLERLIHIELGDLALSSIYLDPAWPNLEPTPSLNPANTRSRSSNNSTNIVTVCPDCGSVHKEIFELQRWKRGANKDKEWENLVKPVVERWGKFVELYV